MNHLFQNNSDSAMTSILKPPHQTLAKSTIHMQRLVPSEEVQTQCFCAKSKPVTIDHEIVCQGCGIVLGIDNEQISSTGSHLNLHLRTEIGANPKDRPREIRKLHIHSSDSSQMSDICQSLFLSDSVTDEIWHIYQKTKSIVRCSKAKSACFAIYYTCRKYEIPFEEDIVRAKVRMSFQVMNAPALLDVFSKINKLSDKIQGELFTTEMGISTNDENPENFYLKAHLKQAQQRHPDINFQKLQNIANSFFVAQKGNNDTRAKNAVRLALGRFGL